ncbi:hypothetical protein FOA52_007905 [Chlamydomonas sp. UWO 241]|nr:hypothetical protein FOA52_007905 [Chlamydomonas sp. UWO 241]
MTHFDGGRCYCHGARLLGFCLGEPSYGTNADGVVSPCFNNGGRFKKGEMMIYYGDGGQSGGDSTYCHVTCVSHDLARGYMGLSVCGDDDDPSGFLSGMERLEPSDAEWATAYLKAMRAGDSAKAASLRESVPKPRREPAKKRAEHPEAAVGAPAPDTPAKKPKAAPKDPKAAPKDPKQAKEPKQAKTPKPAAPVLPPLKASIAGKVFAITGTLEGHVRADFVNHLDGAGVSLSDKVDENTTALIVTEKKPGKAKLEQAIKLGVPRMTEPEFWDAYGASA